MIASPCINVCRIDEALGLCLGCCRTLAEIALWRDASDDVRQRILAELPGRRLKIGPREDDHAASEPRSSEGSARERVVRSGESA